MRTLFSKNSIKTVLKTFLISSAVFLLVPISSATDVPAENVETIDPGDFYGFWEVQEPAGDTCIIIIKRGGRLSCFWTGSGASTILKGTWMIQEDMLIATWESDHIDIITKMGENAIDRRTFEPGMDLNGTPLYNTRGVRIDSRVPGSMTTSERSDRSREKVAQDNSDANIQSTFSGFWRIPQSTGFLGIGNEQPYYYIHLKRNGEAEIALRSWSSGDAVSGNWKDTGSHVEIRWDNGFKDRINKNSSGGYTLESFNRKRTFEDTPNDTSQAEKIDSRDAQQYFKSGDVAQLTTTDIRGTWTAADSNIPGRIEIEGWGNAYKFPSVSGAGSDPGKWRLINDRVEITWVDGSRDVIRWNFGPFIQESYLPGNKTKEPHRIIEVVKVD